MTLSVTHMAWLAPEMLCSPLFGEDEWKSPCRAAKKTGKEPKKPRAIKERRIALDGWNGQRQAPGDGHSGVKTIWIGLTELHVPPACRECLA
jgi:hypothetical protein